MTRKIFIISILSIITLLMAAFTYQKTLKPEDKPTPTILKNNSPKVFFFRQTEGIEHYLDYNAWQDEFNGLMGIMGKALQEEKAVLTRKSTAYYSQFKKDHPDQLVLLHYNGNACDPTYQTSGFFDGHWLYTNGTKITQDLPENWSTSKVTVEDASLFTEYTGRYFDRKEDIAIVESDDKGKPNWFHCEQAQIIDIDYENNLLTIRRGQFKSRPKSFKAGKAYIAAHIVEGPWNGTKNNLMWFYNHSSTCPKDANGQTCSDVLSTVLANRFKPGGELYYYDGFELDVLFRHLFHHSYAYLQNWGKGKRRMADCNGDGIGDMGIIDGVNVYEKGVAEFVRKTRKKLDDIRPGILFMADAGYSTQRSFGYLNGVETEGYGHVGEDGVINWSNFMNVHTFWNQNGTDPSFNYLNHRLHTKRWASHRLAFSSAMYSGSAICQSTSPPRQPNGEYGVWDEFVKGTANELGWLGEPTGDPVHLVLQEDDQLKGEKASKKLLKQIVMQEGTAKLSGDNILLQSSGKEIRFTLKNLEVPSKEFTLAIKAHCEPMKAYYPELARIVTVRPVDKEDQSLLNSYEWWWSFKDRRFGYINNKAFHNFFFFHEVPATNIDVEVVIESTEPVYIESLQFFAAPDAMYRQFENGLILTNPGLYDYTFDLNKLSPGKHYRRIQATEYQDKETNNGQKVGSKLTLGTHDALFLVKE